MGTLNARGCGISTVLAALCFIDPDITYLYRYKMPEQKSIQILKKFPNVLKDVEENCKHLISLKMTASPKTGAYAYFSAAERYGYRLLLVHKERDWNNPGNTHIHRFWTKDARKQYDIETGSIKLVESCDDGCAGERCKALGEFWFFCKDI